MASRSEIVSLYLEAQRTRDEQKLSEIEKHVADNITIASPMGSTSGKEKIMGRMRNPGGGQMAQMQGKLQWSAPVESDGKVSVSADMPADLPLPFPIKGIELKFSFTADDKIEKVDFSPRM